MNNDNTVTYKIPEWAVCALFYGDYSGLSDEDAANLDKFLQTVEGEGHWNLDNDAEPYCSSYNDIHNLASSVYDVQWVIMS